MDIAIDYDATWTSDPPFFHSLVALAAGRGHRPFILTARWDRLMFTDPSRHWGDEVRKEVGGMPIVFAGPEWKKEAAKKAGFAPQFFIDDSPEHVAPQDYLAGKVRCVNKVLHDALVAIASDPFSDGRSRQLAVEALAGEEQVYLSP
jgi:hypothetical protein